MTQLIVSIDNPSMVADIKKAIKMIRGVVSVKAEKSGPNPTTIAAIKDAENGRTIFCGSFESYKQMTANLDDV